MAAVPEKTDLDQLETEEWLESLAAVIERDGAKLRQVGDALDVLTVKGSGTHPQTLRRAGIEQADLLVAVTNNDEANLISSMLAASCSRWAANSSRCNRMAPKNSTALANDTPEANHPPTKSPVCPAVGHSAFCSGHRVTLSTTLATTIPTANSRIVRSFIIRASASRRGRSGSRLQS